MEWIIYYVNVNIIFAASIEMVLPSHMYKNT